MEIARSRSLPGRGQEIGLRPEAGELIRVVHEAQDRVVDHVRGGLGAGREEELEKTQDVFVAPRLVEAVVEGERLISIARVPV
jgi:hypothetical protein